ncbi:hypothetical protein THIARS_50277 [Thiomonas delicata]|uniref:Uncharacterized protein n=1 Tax=Thiomonas delicata TaxID=364030 RepID=A0A238D1C5_THIDL|nr:hypothetical protein THIARS_50277 [Thiomonas delicata]
MTHCSWAKVAPPASRAPNFYTLPCPGLASIGAFHSGAVFTLCYADPRGGSWEQTLKSETKSQNPDGD